MLVVMGGGCGDVGSGGINYVSRPAPSAKQAYKYHKV